MGYSYLSIHPHADAGMVDLMARGGTRRQRGAAIAAYVRKHPGMRRVAVSYSESYGFQTATYARYEFAPNERA